MNNNETIVWAKDFERLVTVWNKLYRDNGYTIKRPIKSKFRWSKLSYWWCITISKVTYSVTFTKNGLEHSIKTNGAKMTESKRYK